VATSSPTGAVFLSYAREDAAAARRIADALRAHDVEVWFDQEELRGGDAWDAKIRQQIKECTLFVAVISGHTQAREEGYFRREWKLAVERTHDIADHVPFLLPVVVDATNQAEAHVPEKFREMQWTELPAAATPELFCTHVKTLLTRRTQSPFAGAKRAAQSAPLGRQARRRWRALTAAAIAAACVAGFALWRGNAFAPKVLITDAPAVAPLSKAQELVARAKSLYEPWDLASQEDFALAARLLKEATDLDSASADAWACAALCSAGTYTFNYDRSDSLREALRMQAERAVKLAPTAASAQLARAYVLRLVQRNLKETERIFREVTVACPENKFAWRSLGGILRDLGRHDEAIAAFDRAVALPGGDPVALLARGITFRSKGNIVDAARAMDQALAARPDYGYAHVQKVDLLLHYFGDIRGACAALENMPAAILLEDRGTAMASRVWLWAREPEKCLTALQQFPRDYLRSNYGDEGPKGYYAGLAHRIAGRDHAAQAEWKVALQVINRRLDATPRSTEDLIWRARLLVLLGDRAGGEETLRLVKELAGSPSAASLAKVADILGELGRPDEAIRYLADAIKASRTGALAARVRFSPALDVLRDHPKFKALLAKLPRTN
jgi:tetratricopeptide (TPR) repeat protein